MTIRKYIQTLLIIGSYLSWFYFLGVFIITFYLQKLLCLIYLYRAYLNRSDDSLTLMETHSKLQLYGVLHLTFGFGNTIANLIYINISINKGRERNCSPYNTDGYICEDFNSLWTVPLLQMAVLCSVWVFIFLYNFLLWYILVFFTSVVIFMYIRLCLTVLWLEFWAHISSPWRDLISHHWYTA